MAIIQRFGLALIFLTRIPWPWPITNIEMNQTRCAAFFPLIGLLIGLLLAGIALLAEQFWSIEISVLLVMLASILLTGAFHEDGLADTSDALGGGFTVEKKLSIMKDSRIGTYGSVALILILLMRWQGLVELQHWLWVLPLSHCISRMTPVLMMNFLPYVTSEASKSRDMVQRLKASDLIIALSTPLLLLIWLPWWWVASALLMALLIVPILLRYFAGHLNGLTGDALGSAQQISDIVILFTLLAIVHV